MNYKAKNLYVHFRPGITINILLQNTRNKMGNSFLTHSARDDNCQNFARNILFATEMRKLTHTITGIGAKMDIIREGGNLLY